MGPPGLQDIVLFVFRNVLFATPPRGRRVAAAACREPLEGSPGKLIWGLRGLVGCKGAGGCLLLDCWVSWVMGGLGEGGGGV